MHSLLCQYFNLYILYKFVHFEMFKQYMYLSHKFIKISYFSYWYFLLRQKLKTFLGEKLHNYRTLVSITLLSLLPFLYHCFEESLALFILHSYKHVCSRVPASTLLSLPLTRTVCFNSSLFRILTIIFNDDN